MVEDQFETDHITATQFEPLKKLVHALAYKYKIASENISRHKDQAQSSCPGENIHKLLPKLRRELSELNFQTVKFGTEQL